MKRRNKLWLALILVVSCFSTLICGGATTATLEPSPTPGGPSPTRTKGPPPSRTPKPTKTPKPTHTPRASNQGGLC